MTSEGADNQFDGMNDTSLVKEEEDERRCLLLLLKRDGVCFASLSPIRVTLIKY